MTSSIDATARNASPKIAADATPRIFNVVIAYDDLAAGQRGMEAFVHLRRDVPGVWDFHCDLWRFDLLHLPGVSDAATLAGMHAQMVIISARADIDLPPPVKTWLHQSLAAKPPGSAAVVALLLLGRESRDASPARTTLEGAAKRRGLRFFAQEFAASGGTAPRQIEALRDRSTPASIVSGEILHSPPRPARWGINE
jgi:hypothetical protein